MVLLATLSYHAQSAEDWEIAWDAAKGEQKISLPYQPQPLDEILTEIPAGHSEANADRKTGAKPIASKVRLLANHNGRKIFEVVMEASDTFYNRYYLILAEVEEARYMPVFVRQFASESVTVGEPVVKATTTTLDLTIDSTITGTAPSVTRYKVSLDKSFKPTTTSEHL